MRYLRMLTNAMAGGVLVAAYLLVLVLQLNPQVPTVSLSTVKWFGAMLAFYGPYLTAALLLLILAREAIGSRPLRPGWLSVRLLAWLGAIGAAAASAITWANLAAFRAVMSDASVERMRDGAWVTTASAVVLLFIALLRYSFGRRGSRPTGVLLSIAMVLSAGVPLWLRGLGEGPVRPPHRWSAPTPLASVPRVRLMVFDGASLGFIRQRIAAGQLPNFGRLLDRGAVMDLATLRPTQAEPVWAAAATGKAPQKNGVRSNATYRVGARDLDVVDLLPDFCFAYALIDQGFVTADELTASAVAARPLWSILADYGIASGLAGWPLTYPARADRGFVVSDRFDEAASSPLRSADAEAGDPTTATDVAREAFDRWQGAPWRDVLVSASDEIEPLNLIRARWDRAYADAALELEQQFAPRLVAVRYEALDTLGHNYLREAQPELFGQPRRTTPRSSPLDRYYAHVDAMVGHAVRRLAPDDLLVVMSGFGMEPTTLSKRLLAHVLGSPDLSGTHESAPDGFLLAYGGNVAPGEVPRGAIADLTPTVLYYMGVPVGRDMDGFARTDLFLATYTLEHPVTYVASHER